MPISSCAAARRLTLAALLAAAGRLAAQPAPTPHQALGRDVLRELVETNTTYSSGSTTRAAERLAARFLAAGFPASDVRVVGPDSGLDAKDRNLVVRYRGRGARRPVLLLGHLDVVEARRDDWGRDPFALVEQDGHFYGRGTLDMKGSDAAWVAALLRLKQEGFVPAGDYVLVFTAGEEGGGGYNGIGWLVARRHDILDRDLLDADYALNADLGAGEWRDGKGAVLHLLTAEKRAYSVTLAARNPGGHSSLPVKDNAITHVANALGRIGAHEFPARTTPVTRAMFAGDATRERGELAAELRAVSAPDTPDSAAAARLSARSPYFNAMLRTTCIATMMSGGHARNALPQLATASIGCRVLPGEDPADVVRTLRGVVADSAVDVSGPESGPVALPSEVPPALLRTLRSVAESVWRGVSVEPAMAAFATDGATLRRNGVPSFGVSGYFADPANPADARAHGLDERIGVRAFYDQLEYTYRLLKAL